jgi:hypothetical protein
MMALPLSCSRRTDAELAPASWGKTSEAVLPEAIAKKSACEYLTCVCHERHANSGTSERLASNIRRRFRRCPVELGIRSGSKPGCCTQSTPESTGYICSQPANSSVRSRLIAKATRRNTPDDPAQLLGRSCHSKLRGPAHDCTQD